MALSADILTRTQSPHITAGEGQVQVQEAVPLTQVALAGGGASGPAQAHTSQLRPRLRP